MNLDSMGGYIRKEREREKEREVMCYEEQGKGNVVGGGGEY